MSRYRAREEAFKTVFQYGFSPEIDIEELIAQAEGGEDAPEFDDELDYYEDTVRGVVKNLEKIDADIERFSTGWSHNRISRVARAIMRISVYEMTGRCDISAGVSINEAVELAKKYADDETGAFVNGLLGAFVRDRESN